LNGNERFVESKLPLSVLNRLSSKESGFIRVPKIHNIHTWFARRPAGAARILTLASILPENVNDEIFVRASSIAQAEKTNRVIYMVNPKRSTIADLLKDYAGKNQDEFTVLDPMAGGGSIPLESLRLGFRTVAVEYNPVAYLITRATVEFPAKYADSGLFEETLKASEEFISRSKEELEKFYSEDAKRYIFARGIRCPFCDGLIPAQGVEPVITKAERFKKRFLKLSYDKSKGLFSAKTTDYPIRSGTIIKRGNNIKCPYCGKFFQLRVVSHGGLTAFDKWFHEHAELMESVVEGFTLISSEIEEKFLQLHIPLVKQVGNTFYSTWDDEAEREKFVDALRDLSDDLFELQNFIPLDPIALENRWASQARNKNLTKWYMLFNPRQLLTITKLSKMIAEIAEDLASKNGEFGAAVATYLAFALDKIVDYNTIATKWQGSSFKTGIGNTLRGESAIDFRKEYCEMGFLPPELSLGWALEPDIAESGHFTKTAGGVLPVLRFLCDEFRDSGCWRPY